MVVGLGTPGVVLFCSQELRPDATQAIDSPIINPFRLPSPRVWICLRGSRSGYSYLAFSLPRPLKMAARAVRD